MSQMITATLRVNGATRSVRAHADTPLLWILRENLKMTGTKYGCGVGQCSSCLVHIDGVATQSCQVPFSDVGARSVTTIEGLSDSSSHAVQKAWIAEQVPQCGYCQSGQVMRAAALLANTPRPTREQIVSEMQLNLCRCGSYRRIIAAVDRAAREG